jgi:hypothetical protein
MNMSGQHIGTLRVLAIFLITVSVSAPLSAQTMDIRGLWVGSAQGSIFGAEGTVTVTQQRGKDIVAMVEGGNFLGSARFPIRGYVSGNMVYGSLEGNHFRGFVYPDGTLRGELKAIDGDTYHVFLRKSYPYWAGPQPHGYFHGYGNGYAR